MNKCLLPEKCMILPDSCMKKIKMLQNDWNMKCGTCFYPNFDEECKNDIKNPSLTSKSPWWILSRTSPCSSSSRSWSMLKCDTCFYPNFSQGMQIWYRKPPLRLLRVHFAMSFFINSIIILLRTLKMSFLMSIWTFNELFINFLQS